MTRIPMLLPPINEVHARMIEDAGADDHNRRWYMTVVQAACTQTVRKAERTVPEVMDREERMQKLLEAIERTVTVANAGTAQFVHQPSKSMQHVLNCRTAFARILTLIGQYQALEVLGYAECVRQDVGDGTEAGGGAGPGGCGGGNGQAAGDAGQAAGRGGAAPGGTGRAAQAGSRGVLGTQSGAGIRWEVSRGV